MRRTIKSLAILFLALSIYSCNSTPIETKNEVWEIDNDSLFAKCATLRGLGNLIIDKTTIKDLSKDKYITMPSGYMAPHFNGGYWKVDNSDLSNYIRDNYKQIKQIKVGIGLYPYKVGELELRDVDCAFLNDTLVAISLKDDYYVVKKVFIERYGNGRGNYSFYAKQKGTDKRYSLEKREHEERVWENENVRFERYYDWDSMYYSYNEAASHSRSEEHCYIISKKRYDTFVSVLNEAKESFEKDKQKKLQQSYDAL